MSSVKKITKILIANRGEIAVRIIRSLRDLNIASVAVFSEADRRALHVQMADEAYCVGPAASNESYLVAEKIIEVAKKSGADAIHPGYGFLSEKSYFSQMCEDNNIIFLGPRPEPIEKMGDKIQAREAALKANVPMIPGIKGALESMEQAKKLAGEIGYPVLLKAAAGGGGKGMRVVNAESEIESAYQMAASEAKKSFNDDTMYIEKFLKKARHVEIQIACDQHGGGIHLFDRECSLQRRHQKVIEEAPCAFISEKTREAMAEASLRLAKNVNYSGVGTLEYMVDEDENFYFLEMNTRLQVEHPVSELITGVDLVALQISIGQGEKLPISQDDLKIRGHAIECRLYAEDPENNFFPSPGKIQWLQVPEGPGIRHDAAVYAGYEIPIFYDPMIAKLVVYAQDRDLAIKKMQSALNEYEIGGFKNNLNFLRTLAGLKEFATGDVYTRYIDENPDLAKVKPEFDVPQEVLLAAGSFHLAKGAKKTSGATDSTQTRQQESLWKIMGRKQVLGS